jgi:hypothetical protein
MEGRDAITIPVFLAIIHFFPRGAGSIVAQSLHDFIKGLSEAISLFFG